MSRLLVGTKVSGIPVTHQDDIAQTIGSLGVEIAVIATPPQVAQQVADALVDAGVTSILNLAPATLHVPSEVAVRNVDLAQEMQILSYHQARRSGGASVPARKAAT